ncbi:glycosyl transferase [Paenibacillus sp. P32E]|nr:glycosyl transferase [Paenibacillus sp. P32E]
MNKCINSWKVYLPDYEIKEWNEKNFDVESNRYTQEAYKEKKWAHVTDYVRLYVLYHHGGVYMDTDVEILKNIDVFLLHSAFSGFEDINLIPTGIMGAEKNNAWIKDLLTYYDGKTFYKDNGELDLVPNTRTITELSYKYGLVSNGQYQVLNQEVYIYPKEYFCPKEYASNKIKITENTYCIHHFNGSWLDKNTRVKRFLIQHCVKIIGVEKYLKIRYLFK